MVSCPVRFCILRVELSAQFRGETPSTYGVSMIEIDGTPDGIYPVDHALFADGGTNSYSSQTFTFMKEGVTNGNHTVTVVFGTANAKTTLNGVTLTVQVFKP